MDARKNDVLTLTNTNGAISHTNAKGETVAAIFIGHLLFPCIHIHSINGHTIQIWGTNESDPADTTNAVQLGTDLSGNTEELVVIESGPAYIFIEVGTAGTGTPTAIITGRVA
jgi:hypothetical protein